MGAPESQVDELLELAASLSASTGETDDTRLIGGLAVRLLVGASARITRDVDLVAMTDDAQKHLLDRLRSEGFRLGRASSWWRAVSEGPPRRIVDVIRHPVIDTQSFQSITLQSLPQRFDLGGRYLSVAAVDDLVRMKLIAGRDQDLVDLLLLAESGRASARDIARAAEVDDAERAVAAGAVTARYALQSGELSGMVEEALERNARPEELEALGTLLSELEKEGL